MTINAKTNSIRNEKYALWSIRIWIENITQKNEQKEKEIKEKTNLNNNLLYQNDWPNTSTRQEIREHNELLPFSRNKTKAEKKEVEILK